jgi:hypothetical protein
MYLLCLNSTFRTDIWGSRDRWIYKYLCNECLLLLKLRVRIELMARCIRLIQHYVINLVCEWFSPGTPGSVTKKTRPHDIAEILMKVALNTITPPRIDMRWGYKSREVMKSVAYRSRPQFKGGKFDRRTNTRMTIKKRRFDTKYVRSNVTKNKNVIIRILLLRLKHSHMN